MVAFDDGRCTVHIGHVLEELAALPADSVHTVCTSPPYFGLRDYKGLPDFTFGDGWVGQLGLEPTVSLYVAHLVEVFEDVRRVLRPDGTLWLNLGDSYAGSGPSGASYQSETTKRRADLDTDGAFRISKTLGARGLTYAEKKPIPAPGLKPKDLIGTPWRVAFALQAAGWWLRSDIVWSKPNPMPESVTDRPTKAHEYLFLLAKRPTYYYDAEAIKEPATARPTIKMPDGWDTGPGGHGSYHRQGREKGRVKTVETPNVGGRRQVPEAGEPGSEGWMNSVTRNRRSVWTIPTTPYPEAHFATFPPDLVRPCVLAGTAADGVVLDPFLGSGATLEVAASLGRRGVGIEGNPTYLPLIEKRLRQGVLL